MANILIVDDEAGIRDLARFILERQGHTIMEAENGEEGLEILEERGADLVILDIMMPGMNGWQVCNEIKGNDKFRDIPVMIMSVKDADEDITTSIQYDADVHISKPFRNEWLVDSVEKLLDK